MQALKALVIFLGILIFVGLGVVGMTIYNRASAPTDASPPAGFGTVRLGLPQDGQITSIGTAGDRLVLHAFVPGEGEIIYIVHLSTGKVLGKIAVNKEP